MAMSLGNAMMKRSEKQSAGVRPLSDDRRANWTHPSHWKLTARGEHAPAVTIMAEVAAAGEAAISQ